MIVIADDVMVIQKNDNHKDHDLAFTTLLQAARRCNSVKLNYDKLKVQVHRSQFLWQNLYNRWVQTCTKQGYSYHVKMPPPSSKNRGTVFHRNGQLLNKIFAEAYQVIWANQRNWSKKKYLSTGAQSTKNHSTCLRRK